MLCHITRPDSVVMEVEVDAKANGEDCLNKVCRKLGIIEVDYFGLQFSGSKGENLWLNLRNRICQQVDSVAPCRLRLRVKFFVEPHLILQEQTRGDLKACQISADGMDSRTSSQSTWIRTSTLEVFPQHMPTASE
ncbi:hypothetical protein NHX12_023102, partial [Muraenolepis orangiensis]